MPPHPSLRHFKNGVSHIKQWTGKEYKMMEKVFIGAVAGGVNNPDVVHAARALLDFITLSQFPAQTSETLKQMEDSFNDFHRFKDVFIIEGVRKHFNIPKLHSLLHYVEAIKSRGTPDGFNTESPERLHIDYAKKAYRASNKKDVGPQMVHWLERHEAFAFRTAYIAWAQPSQDSDGLQELEDDGSGTDSDQESDAKAEDDSEKGLIPFRTASFSYDNITISVAKTPPLQSITVSTIQVHFGAVDFLPCLVAFLRLCHQQFSLKYTLPTQSDSFSVYKQLVLDIQPGTALLPPFRDRVRATPAKVSNILPNLGKVPQFNTMLIQTPPGMDMVHR
ncbi:hypothetical protein FRC03_007232 [Tulasnella sp. 419]|nr:hypothetical protein FRC03_007232 [Tulasnella sp. 419]